jgi:16S rRNA C1402 (ribose-2'-O) methylase RsmI
MTNIEAMQKLAQQDKALASLYQKNAKLLELLKRLEWINGKCPICLGWEVTKGQGECYGVHTRKCELHAALGEKP